MSQDDKREPIKIMLKTLKAPAEEAIKELAPKVKKTKRSVTKAEADIYYDNRRERRERGDMLKYLRNQKGLTQTACASLLGTSGAYYMNIERGNVDVSLAKLDTWLSVLGGRLIIFPHKLM